MFVVWLFLAVWQVSAENSSCLSFNSSDWPAPTPTPQDPNCGQAEELCDGIDNNCNGCTDEGIIKYCWVPTPPQTCCNWTNSTERTACLDDYQNTFDVSSLPCISPTENRSNWLCIDPGDACGDSTDNNCYGGVDEMCTPQPTKRPSGAPTPSPTTRVPTTGMPTSAPTRPTRMPTSSPTNSPTTSSPTTSPTTQTPTTLAPSFAPTTQAPTTTAPSRAPTTTTPSRAPTTTSAPTSGAPTAPTASSAVSDGRSDVTGTQEYKDLIGGLVAIVVFVILVALCCMCYVKRKEDQKHAAQAAGVQVC